MDLDWRPNSYSSCRRCLSMSASLYYIGLSTRSMILQTHTLVRDFQESVPIGLDTCVPCSPSHQLCELGSLMVGWWD